MRIVAGKYKGLVFQYPKNITARPTTDRAKESLFNILDNKIELEGIKALDLFTGTGNITYELASRGAKEVTSVDKSVHSVKYVKEVANKLGATGIKTVKADVFSFINKCTDKFDLIFADPPYADAKIATLPQLIFEKDLLNDGGYFILEHMTNTPIQHEYMVDQRVYGQSAFSFFCKSV